jgi:hypothetical protein
MQFVAPTASQSASLLEAFDNEQQPDVQTLLIGYLRGQASEDAAFALKKFREKWTASDDSIKGN